MTQLSDGARTVQFFHAGDNLSRVIDADGGETDYSYQADGRMTARTRPLGNTPYAQVYDAEGRVATQTAAHYWQTTFSYASETGVTTITDPLAERTQTHDAEGALSGLTGDAAGSQILGTDAGGRRDSVTDALGNATTTTYDPVCGLRASTTYPDGSTVINSYTERLSGDLARCFLKTVSFPDATGYLFEYDGAGNLISLTDRGGNTSSYSYNSRGQVLEVTNPAGATITRAYDADGDLAARTDPAGNTTRYSYDAHHRLSRIEFADLTRTDFAYGERDQLLSKTDAKGQSTLYSYDANGNLIASTNRNGVSLDFTYDEMDRLITASGPLGGTTAFSYDELGRLVNHTNANGNVSSYDYDAAGRNIAFIDPEAAAWASGYNAAGWLTSLTDPLGNVTSMEYDGMGRLTAVTNALGDRTSFGFDVMGRQISETNALGRSKTFAYDERGFLTEIALPGGLETQFERDVLGLITAITLPGGDVWRYDYDDQGRQLSSTAPGAGVTTRTFDARNRVDGGTLPGSSNTVTVSYDANGNIVRQEYSDGTVLSSSYDPEDRLIATGGVALVRDAAGNVVSSNGIELERDLAGRVMRVELATSKAILYAYDRRDNVTTVTDWLGGVSEFTYDAAGRLTSMARPNGVVTENTHDAASRLVGIAESDTATTLASITLTRDAEGNISSADRAVPLSASFAAFTAPEPGSASFDALGRVTSGSAGRSYSWDLASRVRSIAKDAEIVDFSYDGLSRVISRKAGANPTLGYLWNDGLAVPVVSIVRENGIDATYYVHSPLGDLLYSIDAATGDRSFYHYDELGSTIFLTDDDGIVTDAYAYTPYGLRLATTGSSKNPYTYHGRFGVMQEDAAGLYRMGRRLYDAEVARFLSLDPVFKPLDPRTANPYAFAAGNPLRYIDPSGEAEADTAEGGPPPVPVPNAINDGLYYQGKVSAVASKFLDEAIAKQEVAFKWAEKTGQINKAIGKKNPKYLDAALEYGNRLGFDQRQADLVSGAAGKVSLALTAYEKGPQGVVEHYAEQGVEKVIGKKGIGAIKIGIEAYKTNERVINVVNQQKRENRSHTRNQDVLIREAWRSYKLGRTNFDELENRIVGILEAYRLSVEGTSDAGFWGVAHESTEGLKNMLETLISMD